MVYDVCFPKDNEQLMIAQASLFGYNGVCFFYTDSKKITTGNNLPALIAKPIQSNHLSFSCFEMKTQEKMKIFYYNSRDRASFISPAKEMTQVAIKDIKSCGGAVLLPFSSIRLNMPENVEKFRHVIRLCDKYDVQFFIASCAQDKKDMRPAKELESVIRIIAPFISDASSHVGYPAQ